MDAVSHLERSVELGNPETAGPSALKLGDVLASMEPWHARRAVQAYRYAAAIAREVPDAATAWIKTMAEHRAAVLAGYPDLRTAGPVGSSAGVAFRNVDWLKAGYAVPQPELLDQARADRYQADMDRLPESLQRQMHMTESRIADAMKGGYADKSIAIDAWRTANFRVEHLHGVGAEAYFELAAEMGAKYGVQTQVAVAQSRTGADALRRKTLAEGLDPRRPGVSQRSAPSHPSAPDASPIKVMKHGSHTMWVTREQAPAPRHHRSPGQHL